MIKKICVVTGTRAEYGLLKPLITIINNDEDLKLQLVATGMHLSHEFGATYREIEEDGFVIDEKIEIVLSSNSNVGVSKSIGLAVISFSEYFERNRPDILIILGDRYEAFAVAVAAAVGKIPIAHISGGDTTEGVTDEFFRHSITKMSYLHFPGIIESKKRIEQLGEDAGRVFSVGELGVENILILKYLAKDELENSINFKLDKPFVLVTFHPATIEDNTAEEQFVELLSAIDCFKDLKFIFTKANSDANGRLINKLIDEYVLENNNSIAFTSLGLIRYLSAMRFCAFVLGNSSSGIVEAPSFKIPTVNIGDRQRGRNQSVSIINCSPKKYAIVEAMNKALSKEFRNSIIDVKNPYEGENTSKTIVNIIKDFLFNNKIDLKKKFYDLEDVDKNV